MTVSVGMVYSLPSANGCGFGKQTQILNASGRSHHWSGIGPLSIKCFLTGGPVYRVGRAVYRVLPSSYLVLNQGQQYEISIQTRAPTESFCIFFAPGLVEEAARSLAKGTNRLLDKPQDGAKQQIHFFERLYPAYDS